jgi:RNA polymerase nonessential primary-like sigma factor
LSVEFIDYQDDATQLKSDELERREQPVGDHDLIRTYLNDIGKTALLSAEDEVELAKRIEAGVYASKVLEVTAQKQPLETDKGDVLPIQRLTAAKRRDYNLLIEDGDAAKKHMLEANLRLVVSLAKRYNGGNSKDMPLLDLIQEGNTGLMRAVEKFDYAKGFKFSTYATWWIRQAITRGIADQARTIRMPVHMVEQINKLNRIKRELHVVLGHEPTSEEIAFEAELEVEKVETLIKLDRAPASLNQPVGSEGEEAQLGDFITAHGEENTVADQVEFHAMQDDLSEVMRKKLDEREFEIISMRFGLDNGNPMTLSEIGEVYGLSRERIRQIETESMRKLRKSDEKEQLRDYIS